MRSGTIAFLLGIVCLQGFATLPAREWIILLVVSIPAALFLTLPWRLFGWGLSGFLWCLWSAHQILAVELPVVLEGQDLVIEGRIAGLPESRERSTRFLFAVSQLIVDGERRSWPATVRLNWYGQPPALQSGDGWRLQVRLKRPHGFRNPGGFDYERWLFAHRIRATGYVREAQPSLDGPVPMRFALDRFRQWLSERLTVHLSGQSGALMRALTLGDRRAISAQTWQWLRQTGTAHLLAISGMHIGLLAALVFWLMRRLWPLAGERAVNRLPAPRVAAVFAMLGAVGYAALAGFSIPTQRALVMLLVIMLALWRMRPLVPGQTLAWAGLLVLVLDPLAVLSAGFWLSFAAVAVILYVLGGYRLSWPHQWLRMQAGVTLGLTPLLLGWFQQVSLVAPLTNLLAIPLVSLLVVPLALLAMLGIAFWPDAGTVLLVPVAWLLDGLLAGLAWFAVLPGAHWQSAGGVPALGLLGAGVILALAPRGLPGRYLAVLLCLPLLFGAPLRPPPDRFWLTLLDVGQGLATAVQTRSHVLIFDTGPRYSARFDTGAAVVLPYLRQAGYRRVDRLVISHGDNDHRGGLASLRAGIPIDRIYI
ncbi:MAG: DNA internalization-related competence protein ComEC/Rec2, partial [Thiohalophilus sp.]